MLLVDVTYPDGALDARACQELATHFMELFTGSADTAPEATLAAARRMTQFAFRPAQGWTTGDGPWDGDGPPPLWVTVTVPDAWREDGMDGYVIGMISQAVKRCDRKRGQARRGGDLWVNVVGIADGSIGRDGVPSTADDVVLHMTEEYRAGAGAGADEVDLPEGTVVDPICGMHVRLVPSAITLAHDDTVVGFCSQGCRRAYASEHDLEIPAA